MSENVVKFNTTDEYEVFKSSSAYTAPNVSWIVKENAIASEPYLYPLTSGIVIHKNGVFKEVSYDDFNEHYDSIIAKGYSIEGVIAVPSTHTPDGTTRIMSLKYMATGSPETGTAVTATIHIGGRGESLDLTSYGKVVKTNNSSSETIIDSVYEGFLPSDMFTSGTQSFVDEKAMYDTLAVSASYCPSPFLTGDEPNPLYRTTSISNGFSDFDGSGNTDAMIALVTGQTDWQTASTITNNYYGAGFYPAACCCKRYGTTGLPPGSWYLPACGELGYVAARAGSINSLLTLINTKDPSIGAGLITNTVVLWSSTYYSVNSAIAINLAYAAQKINKDKEYTSQSRAFASVHSKPMIF